MAQERAAQASFFAKHHPGAAGYRRSPYSLEHREMNLAPAIRDKAERYFSQNKIVWHRHASHGLSSQVCCLNFLMPLAEHPELLAKLVGRALDIPPPDMQAVEDGPDGQPWYVGFEWIGREDYLGEAGGRTPTRGANVTSADAVVRFFSEGRLEALLIEWKYTEFYGAPLSGGESAAATRASRYRDKMIAPTGPIRPDANVALEAFFYEPFYQLLRQQMLAGRMQQAKEDGVERVRVLHISPAGNTALHKVTAPALQGRTAGGDAFIVFADLLARPDDFIAWSTERLFAPLLDDPDASGWADYLRERYVFLSRATSVAVTET